MACDKLENVKFVIVFHSRLLRESGGRRLMKRRITNIRCIFLREQDRKEGKEEYAFN